MDQPWFLAMVHRGWWWSHWWWSD